jgi:hypothetical protein
VAVHVVVEPQERLIRFKNELDQLPPGTTDADRQDFGAPNFAFLTHLHNGHTQPESDGQPHYAHYRFGALDNGGRLEPHHRAAYEPGEWVDDLYLNYPAGGDDAEKQYTSGVVLSHGKSLVAPRPGHTWCVPGFQPYLAANSSWTPGSVTSALTWSCGLSGPGASGQLFQTDSGTGLIAPGIGTGLLSLNGLRISGLVGRTSVASSGSAAVARLIVNPEAPRATAPAPPAPYRRTSRRVKPPR